MQFMSPFFTAFFLCFNPPLDVCRDGFGILRPINSKWVTGHNVCNCIIPESRLYFWDGTDPSPPVIECELNGCPNPWNGPLLRHGDKFVNNQGHPCECRRGTNPWLMDASTEFHVKCHNTNEDNATYYTDFMQT